MAQDPENDSSADDSDQESGSAADDSGGSESDAEDQGHGKLSFGPAAKKAGVSSKTQAVLKMALGSAKEKHAVITSTARSMTEQAKGMFEVLERDGEDAWKDVYSGAGKAVLAAYKKGKSAKKSAAAIAKSMESEIKKQGPANVSRHCVDTSKLNIVDILISSLKDRDAVHDALSAHPDVAAVIIEDNVLHVEVRQSSGDTSDAADSTDASASEAEGSDAEGAQDESEADASGSESGDAEVTLKRGPKVGKVPKLASQVVKQALTAAGEKSALVTCLLRTPEEQAKGMFEGCQQDGTAKWEKIYDEHGKRVIDVYKKAKKNKEKEDAVIRKMLDQIKKEGPGNVSRHCTGGEVHGVARVVQLSFEDAHFNLDSALLLPDFEKNLDAGSAGDAPVTQGLVDVGRALSLSRKYKANRLLVAGHTDTTGSADYNQALSEARAGAVLAVLSNQRQDFIDAVNGHYGAIGSSKKKRVTIDLQFVMTWAARFKGWDCNPKGIDGADGAHTDNAISVFGQQANCSPTIDDPTTWLGAVFDLYNDFLSKESQIVKAGGLAACRSAANKPAPVAVGYGLRHPLVGSPTVPERNEVNRRVELIWFPPGPGKDYSYLDGSSPDVYEKDHGKIDPHLISKYDWHPAPRVHDTKGGSSDGEAPEVFVLDLDIRSVKSSRRVVSKLKADRRVSYVITNDKVIHIEVSERGDDASPSGEASSSESKSDDSSAHSSARSSSPSASPSASPDDEMDTCDELDLDTAPMEDCDPVHTDADEFDYCHADGGGPRYGAPVTYVVQSGDSLSKIALDHYGDATLWPLLYQVNQAVVGDDPNLIQPGQNLEIRPITLFSDSELAPYRAQTSGDNSPDNSPAADNAPADGDNSPAAADNSPAGGDNSPAAADNSPAGGDNSPAGGDNTQSG